MPANVWARPGMTVTFRAELMPGRDREARTAKVKNSCPAGECYWMKLPESMASRSLIRLAKFKPSQSQIFHITFFISHFPFSSSRNVHFIGSSVDPGHPILPRDVRSNGKWKMNKCDMENLTLLWTQTTSYKPCRIPSLPASEY